MNTITPEYVLSALWRQKIKAVFTFLLITGLTLGAFLVWPKKYRSEGQLYVQLGRSNTGLDPTPGRPSVSIQDTRETEIRSVAELVGSRAVIEEVVDELGVDAILFDPWKERFGDYMPDLAASIRSTDEAGVDGQGRDTEQLKRREKAIKKIEESVSIGVEKKTSVITIRSSAYSPELAQQIADALMRHAQAKYLEIHSVKSSADFFEAEYQQQKRVLADAIQRQKDFRDRNGFLSVGGARNTVQQLIDKIEGELLDARAQLAQSDEQYSRLMKELAGILPEIEVPRTGVERLSYEESTTELFTLKREAERLRSTYTENHPQIQMVESQIAKLERELENMATDRVENEKRKNPVYEQVQVDVVRAKATADAARARLRELERKFVEAQQRMEALNEAEAQAIALEQDIQVARQDLAIYAQKRGEAKVLDQLDRQRISDVVIAQPASYIVKHYAPKGSVVVPLGALIGLFAALAVALYSDRKNLERISPEQAESMLDVPVLVTLPKAKTVRQRVS